MINKLKKYVEDRDKMLKKCDVNELRKFVNEHKEFYTDGYIEAFNAATDEVLLITLHKMIVNVTSMPFKMRQKSADWLLSRGYSLTID